MYSIFIKHNGEWVGLSGRQAYLGSDVIYFVVSLLLMGNLDTLSPGMISFDDINFTYYIFSHIVTLLMQILDLVSEYLFLYVLH